MEQQNYNYNSDSVFVQEGSVSKKFFANVFTLMFAALTISTLAAYLFATNEAFQRYIFLPESGLTTLGYIAIFSPLAMVLIIGSGALSRLPYIALLVAFIVFSLVMGISLSFLGAVYTDGSIVSCFGAAGVIFGIMALLGYTTDVDLSKYRTILLIGVVGLFVTGIINMFIQSEQFSLIRAFIGVAVFTALTAYDVQMIKRLGQGIEKDGGVIEDASNKKLAIMAALSLYLDFVNIFLFLLRIFGGRK
ncbi:MAG: Bax inhibitor-1/YccA family protein [Pedobacter sp.]|nr:MAG: Bax inhibitor-1/YccA family protein [Pedobacter sp.]